MMIRGTVVHGKKQGRTIGFPTANVEYPATETGIEAGVWTCFVTIEGARHPAVAAVGMWTLTDGQPSVEAYILDFSQDVYGQVVEVELGEWLRGLESFTDVETLKQRIQQDVDQARTWFSSHS